MKGAALASLFFLFGCAPVVQTIQSAPPQVAFVYEQVAPGEYRAAVYASEPAKIRRVVLMGHDFSVPDDPTCKPWLNPDTLACGEGVSFGAAPRGYRLNIRSQDRPVGNACVVLGGDVSRLLCRDLEPL